MIFATLNRKREDFKGHVKTVLVCSIFKSYGTLIMAVLLT